MNIFIEGIQGTGKTTLLRKLESMLPNYKAFYEGKLSPVELAWCSYMNELEYEEICKKYSEITDEIKQYTLTEGSNKIVAYTKIITDYEGFHRHLEEYTIYHGNKCYEEFKSVILNRYSKVETNGNVFESSFFQYVITTMMLFYEMSDEEIIGFYREVFDILKNKNFRLLYIDTDNVKDTITKIKTERVDWHCNEVWFPPLMKYIESSPLGINKGYKGFDGVIVHLENRKQLELRIINEVVKEYAIVVRSCTYEIESIIKTLGL